MAHGGVVWLAGLLKPKQFCEMIPGPGSGLGALTSAHPYWEPHCAMCGTFVERDSQHLPPLLLHLSIALTVPLSSVPSQPGKPFPASSEVLWAFRH